MISVTIWCDNGAWRVLATDPKGGVIIRQRCTDRAYAREDAGICGERTQRLYWSKWPGARLEVTERVEVVKTKTRTFRPVSKRRVFSADPMRMF